MTDINTSYEFSQPVDTTFMRSSSFFREHRRLADAMIESSNLPFNSSLEDTQTTHPLFCIARLTASSQIEWRRVQTLQASNAVFFQQRKSFRMVRGGLPNQVVSLFKDLAALLADETGLTESTVDYRAAVNLGCLSGKPPPRREFYFVATTLRDMQTYVSIPAQFTGYVDNNNYKLDLVVIPPALFKFLPKNGKNYMSLMFSEQLVWSKVLMQCQVFQTGVMDELARKGFLHKNCSYVSQKLAREGKDSSEFDHFLGFKKRSIDANTKGKDLTMDQMMEKEVEKVKQGFFVREYGSDYLKRPSDNRTDLDEGQDRRRIWKSFLKSGKKRLTNLVLGSRSTSDDCSIEGECQMSSCDSGGGAFVTTASAPDLITSPQVVEESSGGTLSATATYDFPPPPDYITSSRNQ